MDNPVVNVSLPIGVVEGVGVKSNLPKIMIITGDVGVDLLSIHDMLKAESPSKVLLFPEEGRHPATRVNFGGVVEKILMEFSQLLIFTYDEIIFNAFRLMVKQGKLSPEDIKVIHFYNGGRDYQVVKVLPSGKCDVWPKGFMGADAISQLALLVKR